MQRLVDEYEHWLGDGPHFSIMRLLRVFDRPADRAVLMTIAAERPVLSIAGSVANLNMSAFDWITSDLLDS